jgi:gag-polypeptide of LTR copia-type
MSYPLPENRETMSQQNEKITHITLNGTNYLPWLHTVTIGLGDKSKLEYVTGELPKPIPVNPNFPTAQEKKALKEWRTEDLVVTSWLLNSMEPAIADIYMCAGSAQAIWEKVEKRFGQKNNHARIFHLQIELHQAKKQLNQTITEWLNFIEKKRDEIRLYRPSTTDLDELQKRADQDDIFQFLASLDSSYENLRS